MPTLKNYSHFVKTNIIFKKKSSKVIVIENHFHYATQVVPGSSKGVNSVSDYSKSFMELFLCDNQGWCKTDDMIMGGLR